MAAESLEIRMARLEGSYERVDKRLGTIETGLRDMRVEMVAGFESLRAEIGAVRTEFGAEIGSVRHEIGSVRGEIGSLRGEMGSLRQEVRQEIRDLRGDMRQQFYWVIGLLVVSYLVPIALRFLPP